MIVYVILFESTKICGNVTCIYCALPAPDNVAVITAGLPGVVSQF